MGRHCKSCSCPKVPTGIEWLCEYCGNPCKRTAKRALCSLKCRLLGNVDKSGECLLWKGKIGMDGYGLIMIGNKRHRVHRISYMRFVRDNIPSGMLVRHSCDVKACINPEHLSIGTVQDNSNDFGERQGHPKGELAPNCKLKKSQVSEIRDLYSKGSTQQQLANLFGVSQNMISHIILRKSWSHI